MSNKVKIKVVVIKDGKEYIREEEDHHYENITSSLRYLGQKIVSEIKEGMK